MCTKWSCCHPLFCRSKNKGGGNENFWAICKNLRLTQHVELVESCLRMFAFCWWRAFTRTMGATFSKRRALHKHSKRSTQKPPWGRWRVTAGCTNFGVYAREHNCFIGSPLSFLCYAEQTSAVRRRQSTLWRKKMYFALLFASHTLTLPRKIVWQQ